MPAITQKNALEQALGQFATDEERDNCVRICHAVLSTSMVAAATSSLPADKKAALMEMYGDTIKLLETKFGATPSPFLPHQKTIFVAGRGAIPTSPPNSHASRSTS